KPQSIKPPSKVWASNSFYFVTIYIVVKIMVFPMTESAAEWMNVGDVYTTSGICLQPGTFIDKNGNELTLTEEEIEEILNGVSEPVPFTIDHHSETIGYAMRF